MSSGGKKFDRTCSVFTSFHLPLMSLLQRGSRPPTLPPLSSRTLGHPSFLPLYLTAGYTHPHPDCRDVHPITPEEFFYSDPTMRCGRRVPNSVSELKVFDCFQLNTPSPVMSACPAPPTRPDPFRSGPHPTRDLGDLTSFKINTLHPPVQPSRVVIQLTQEEDQAITNLLKLHHQEPLHSSSGLEVYKPFCSDVQHLSEASSQGQGRCWSDTELEAANTLLSGFSLMEGDRIWSQNHNKSKVTQPDPLPYQRQRSETPPGAITAGCTQQNISFSCVRECGEPGWEDFVFLEGRNADNVHVQVCQEYLASPLPPRLSSDRKPKSSSSVSGDFSEVKEWMLSDSEGDAVHVLLNLRDMGVMDIV
ncbi:uncharacterized protein LOC118338530 [Morone saxatilis]|uniref:uncharacterized protein LOC118338530 n=1 Tax=Morone saxatilis TaxID=34816 RepID=UPI0015E21FC6|nr:uncharacterized protein LOC118338530 [Morone saxatilis]